MERTDTGRLWINGMVLWYVDNPNAEASGDIGSTVACGTAACLAERDA